MKAIITQEIEKIDLATHIRFRIIGERKEDSLEIPMWEKNLIISDMETTVTEEQVLKLLYLENSIKVFERFYNDNFNK